MGSCHPVTRPRTRARRTFSLIAKHAHSMPRAPARETDISVIVNTQLADAGLIDVVSLATHDAPARARESILSLVLQPR